MSSNYTYIPTTQSLPDLSSTLLSSSPEDDHYPSSPPPPPLSTPSPILAPSLHVSETLGPPKKHKTSGREPVLDDTSSPPPLSTRPTIATTRQSSSTSGAVLRKKPSFQPQLPPQQILPPLPPSRTPSTRPQPPGRSHSSTSSISSLGSIHSAPELLLSSSASNVPLPKNGSPSLIPFDEKSLVAPPELVRQTSSSHVGGERGERDRKRQSIAIMESRQRPTDSAEEDDEEEDEERLCEIERRTGETTEEEYGEEERRSRGRTRRRRKREFPSTLWEYLKEEVLTVEVDGGEGLKSERVTNFLTVPQELEKIILFGFIICLDSFLYTFTILPLRSLSALYTLISSYVLSWVRWRRRKRMGLTLSQKCDLIKTVVVGITVVGLHRVTDASKMYHGVRGQETIKLYVLFNVLEIADRLCCSFGQDLSDSLFSTSTLSPSSSNPRSRLRFLPSPRPFFLFILYTLYVISHSLVLFYQLVTLNVAVNSYSNALLTLLLSNQFVEIKGSVFKKFEKENLFQLTCADIVERFQLALMLFIISLRNLLELSSSSPSSSPTSSLSSSSSSSPFFPSPTLLLSTFSPALKVLLSECFVDWLKHAFITKFNHIRPKVYRRYVDVLCKDLVKGQSSSTTTSKGGSALIDQSPSVARRLGFAVLPLSCLVIRVVHQAFEMLGDESGLDECLVTPTTRTGSSSSLVAMSTTSRRGQGQGWIGWENVGEWEGWEEVVKWGTVGCVGLGVWICLITLKLLIGINLRTFATERWNGIEKFEREEEDSKSGKSRGGIGISPAEAIEIEKTNKLLRDKQFDQPSKPGGGGGRSGGGGGGGGKDKIELEDLGRYDMVRSRLW
ncbi:hypothetical protein JCM16303_000083 [Sporobolomyces ruberrimus]